MHSIKQILALLSIAVCFQLGTCKLFSGITNATATGISRTVVYTYHPEESTFFGALQRCAVGNGAILAAVPDDQELKFLCNMIPKESTTSNLVWVGAIQITTNQIHTRPTFAWINSDTPIENNLWAAGHPIGSSSDVRRCALLKRSSSQSPWKLVDSYCDTKAAYLCAK